MINIIKIYEQIYKQYRKVLLQLIRRIHHDHVREVINTSNIVYHIYNIDSKFNKQELKDFCKKYNLGYEIHKYSTYHKKCFEVQIWFKEYINDEYITKFILNTIQNKFIFIKPKINKKLLNNEIKKLCEKYEIDYKTL